MRCATCRRRACACIAAGATTKGRITTTCRCATCCRCCSRPSRRRCCSRPPIRATRTNGPCSAMRRLPDDKILIPGVLSSTTNYVEHPELVAERLLRFADIVGRERVMAGSDCGFSTFAGFGAVDPGHRLHETRRDGRRRAAREPQALGLGWCRVPSKWGIVAAKRSSCPHFRHPAPTSGVSFLRSGRAASCRRSSCARPRPSSRRSRRPRGSLSSARAPPGPPSRCARCR